MWRWAATRNSKFFKKTLSLIICVMKFLDLTLRNDMIENVKKRILLIMTCCVLLSGKMNSASIFINAQVVRLCLLCKGIRLSVEDINATELDIYTITLSNSNFCFIRYHLFLAYIKEELFIYKNLRLYCQTHKL